MQIIVTKELDSEAYVALRILSKDITKRDIALFFEKTKNNVNPGERENLAAVLTASMAANRQIYEEFRKEYPEMSDFLMSFFENEFEEVRIEGKIEGKIEEKKAMAIKLYKRGISPEEIADLVEMTLDKVMEWIGILQ